MSATAGVGMPATLHLVGSAARGKVWRDVDVRLILPNKEFDALFPSYGGLGWQDGKWSLLCAAISELGRQRTGLPIDFQIQRQTDANHMYDGPRHALGLRVGWSA